MPKTEITLESTPSSVSDFLIIVKKNIQKIKEDFDEKFKHLPETIKKNNEIQNTYMYLLSTYGWYVSGDMKYESILQIFFALKSRNVDAAESIVSKYYKTQIAQKEKELICKFPERKKLLKETFLAHRKKMYNASTILFLSQADGICEGKMFRRKKVLKDYLDLKTNPDLIKAVLGKESAIDADTRKNDTSNYFSNLNRHGVMHGLHSDYGIEKNSLKALSLLCFISDFT